MHHVKYWWLLDNVLVQACKFPYSGEEQFRIDAKRLTAELIDTRMNLKSYSNLYYVENKWFKQFQMGPLDLPGWLDFVLTMEITPLKPGPKKKSTVIHAEPRKEYAPDMKMELKQERRLRQKVETKETMETDMRIEICSVSSSEFLYLSKAAKKTESYLVIGRGLCIEKGKLVFPFFLH